MKTRLGVSVGFKKGRPVPRFSAGITFDPLKFLLRAIAMVRAAKEMEAADEKSKAD